ncbi:MAG: hypothetical protein M1816_000807 [Peltula sp. TS41687]|nr:MAG: hypothetical protein M1816_000807 [Peltula sp. TS41687]
MSETRSKLPSSNTELPRDLVLKTLVPHASDVDLEYLIADQGLSEAGNGRVSFSKIAQRDLLYYDENVDVYIILSASCSEELEGELRSLFSRLAITLEAHAIQSRDVTKPEDRILDNHVVAKELIFAHTVDDAETPFFLSPNFSSKEDHHDQRRLHAVWKVTASLRRPRTRVHHPWVTFLATAELRLVEGAHSGPPTDEYLPSLVPAGTNVLEPFQDGPAMAHTRPYLSAKRVSRITPTEPATFKQSRRLEGRPGRAFRVVPAVNFKIKYSRLSLSSPSIITSIDFELTPFAEHDVALEEAHLWLENGTAQCLLDSSEADLPLPCRAGDKLSLLYQLTPDLTLDQMSHQPANVKVLDLFMMVKAFVSDDCQPRLTMRWRTNVDFTMQTRLGSGTSGQFPEQPCSQGINSHMEGPGATSGIDNKLTSHTTILEGESNHTSSLRHGVDGSRDVGVIVTIEGPPEVHVGKVFRWNVFIINRSSRPRELALTVIPKRRRSDNTNLDLKAVSPKEGKSNSEVADAVLDQKVLYAMQRLAATDTADLVSLSSDVRVGPLAPGACHTVDLEFLALATGVLNVAAVQVLDLLTQKAVDIQDLPGPLLHALILLIELIVMFRLVSKYNSYYADKPVLTMMVTNAVLGGIADTVAQSLTAIRQRALRKPGGVGKNDFLAIEIHELDEKNPLSPTELIPPSKRLPPPFDFERLTRFMSYGFMMAPVQFKWFQFLSRAFPITKAAGLTAAFKRVAMDQLIMAPAGLACFFTFMTVAEGGGKRAVARKFQDVYVPALKANYVIWPTVQLLNFRVVPLQFQLPLVSTISIAWTAYLSLTNSSDEV